jgi:hypothetical protein
MKPFLLVDWHAPFLPAVATQLAASSDGDFRDVLVIFPHKRPIRSLFKLLQEGAGGAALLPPRMSTVNDWMEATAKAFYPGRRLLGVLDRVHLLHSLVLQLMDEGLPFAQKLGRQAEDIGAFFPWALELDKLMEELFRAGLSPHAIDTMETEAFAGLLLEGLDHIHSAWLDILDNEKASTPGHTAMLAGGIVEEAPEKLLKQVAGQRIVCAGLYAMSGCEERLLRFLWEHGLVEMILPVDPEVAQGGGHPSCREVAKRITAWGAKTKLYEGSAAPAEPLRISFVEAYDLHSQLAALRKDMDEGEDTDTAVVLPEESALMPVLHRFHDKLVNVSMGYPLARTPLFRLLELPAHLQHSARPGTAKDELKLHRQSLTALVRHPFIRRGFGEDFAAFLPRFEAHLRKQGAFLSPWTWLKSLPDEEATPELKAHFEDLLRTFVTNFSAVRSLRDAGEAVLQICVFLHAAAPEPQILEGKEEVGVPGAVGGPGKRDRAEATAWEYHPVDAECLQRLVAVIIPQLTDSALADAPLGKDSVFSVLRQFLERERVPFEAEPLVDIQILGMLEARLLSFSRLYILDASDEVLPGRNAYEPLLPDSLRKTLGLPDESDGKLVQAYNLHAMVRQAGRSLMLYPQGAGDTGEDGTSASMRSRYVEDFIWQEEQRRGSSAEDFDDFIQVVDVRMRAVMPKHADLPKPPEVSAALGEILEKGISPTFLDAYLKCPVRFFHERIAQVKETALVEETGDPPSLGSIVHTSLQSYFTQYIGRTVSGRELPHAPLIDIFIDCFRSHPSTAGMSYDARLSVEASARKRLPLLLQNTPEGSILAVEETLHASFSSNGRRVPVTCRIDRMDMREDTIHILDYKTGALPRFHSGHITDGELHARLAEAAQGTTAPSDELFQERFHELFHELADAVESIQLPLYLYAHGSGTGPEALQAAWISLREDCKEKPFFPKKYEAEKRREYIMESLPAIIGFLIHHMLHAERFPARPGRQCSYCPYSGPCLREMEEL